MLKPLGGRHRPLRTSAPATSPICRSCRRSTGRFPRSVADLVALGLWSRRGMLGRITPADRARHRRRARGRRAWRASSARGIDTLSGGQLQRALFARVLLQDARLILLDEPFNAIDTRTVRDLIDIIHRWHGEERTVHCGAARSRSGARAFSRARCSSRASRSPGARRARRCGRRTSCGRGSSTRRWDEHAPWSASGARGMTLYDLLIAPFVEFEFMRRALVGTRRCCRCRPVRSACS